MAYHWMLYSYSYIISKVIDYGNLGVCVYGYDVRIHTIDRFVNIENSETERFNSVFWNPG